MKKLFSATMLSLLLLVTLMQPVLGAGPLPSAITVKIDGETQSYDQPPEMINNSVMVPLRGIFQALGATLKLEGKKITAVKDSRTVQLTIGEDRALINGQEVKLQQKSTVINNRTLVPLRFVADALGANVRWEQATRTVYITTSSGTKDPVQGNRLAVEVVRVVDGDTIVVKYNDKEERLRLIGVDTPESVHPEKGEQPFGKEASDYTKAQLAGKTVEIEFDVEQRDQYGRLLAYVWLDGKLFNETLVKEGYAVLLTWPPNVKYVERFTAAQKEAREKGKGLWGIDDIAKQYRVGNYDIDPSTGLPLQKVNINTATLEELQLIPGVGEVLAKRIIEVRTSKPFTDPKELTKVSGIGDKTVEKMLPYVTV